MKAAQGIAMAAGLAGLLAAGCGQSKGEAQWSEAERAEVKSVSSAMLSSGLRAHYRFDGALKDHSGGGFDATLGQGADCSVDGVEGQACRLQNKGFLNVAVSPLPRSTETGYTGAAWIRIEDEKKPKYVIGIGTAESFAMKYYRGGIGCIIKDASGYQPMVLSATGIEEGTWHHVACVYDRKASTLTGYLDGRPGQAMAVKPLGPLADPEKNGMGIGCLAAPISCTLTSPFTQLDVDELRLYARALSRAEVRALAGAAKGDGKRGR